MRESGGMVYAADLKSADQKSCGFKSRLSHQLKSLIQRIGLFSWRGLGLERERQWRSPAPFSLVPHTSAVRSSLQIFFRFVDEASPASRTI